MKNLSVNMVSESDISVQGHGVHTAYVEISEALEKRSDISVHRSEFGKKIDCDVVHFHTIGLQTWPKLFQVGPKKVMSAHVVPASFIGSIILAKYWRFIARWYMRWYYNRADKVLAVSQTVASVLRDELRVPERKIEIFYNTINMSRYKMTPQDKSAARKSLGIDPEAFVVIGNGQVQPRKRLDIFIKMAHALPDVTFVWVGGIPFKQLGADYGTMQTMLKNLPDNFRVTGIVPHNDVRNYLAAADVFCLPAVQENHPMCVLEAAGAGLPIILRDIPEYKDTFAQDVILCDDEMFAEKVALLRDDTSAYQRQQKHTQAIAKRFDSDAAADRLVKLYKQLI